MNKSTIVFISIFIAALMAFFSNPNVEKHREAVKMKAKTLMQQSLYTEIDDNNSYGIDKNIGSILGSMLGSAIINPFIEGSITTDNYIFFSTTKLTWDGKTKEIGFGVFGYVFLSNNFDNELKDQLQRIK